MLAFKDGERVCAARRRDFGVTNFARQSAGE
jgi:hypothetical protein